MSDIASEQPGESAEQGLLLSWLQAFDGPNVRLTEIHAMSTISRNRLVRLEIDGGTYRSVVAKYVSRATDRFFAHHLRREERVLDLLQTYAPGLAPGCLGLLLHQTTAGWLLMSDVGERSLAETLRAAPSTEHEGLLTRAVVRVRELHETFTAHHVPFFRTCYAVDLDRLTRESIGNRFRVAWRRTARLARAADQTPPSLTAQWVAAVAPLLSGRKRLVHNSLSPLSMVLDRSESMTIVDFETVTVGAVEFDYAELMLQPFGPITLVAALRILENSGENLTDAFVTRMRLAALCRGFDYVGANAWQLEGGDPLREGEVKTRLIWYANHVRDLALQIGNLDRLVLHLDAMQASAV